MAPRTCSTSPLLVDPQGADAVAAGHSSTCVLRGGDAWCFGNNGDGRLGLGAMSGAAPTQLTGTWREISLGQRHGCGIRADGALACWGDNQDGQIGDGSFDRRLVPTPVGTDTDWEQIVATVSHSCGLRSDGSLWCWGRSDDGALGTGTSWSGALQLVP